MYFRSDMAVELRNRLMSRYSKEHKGEPDGIKYTENGRVTAIEVQNENGARLLGRPVGRYVTVNVGRVWESDPGEFRECADAIADVISSMRSTDGSVLIAGLGNRYITADALGPYTVRHVIATHHISDTDVCRASGLGDAAVISPGVLSQTGIEAAEQIKAAVGAVCPSLVVVIDALAAASVDTLSTSVQITDTGISPGSGVGNDRGELSERVLGVPVIAVGVPTVVDAAVLSKGSEASLDGFYVCPKDSDRSVAELARLIGYAINRVCHPDVPYDEMAYI